MQPDREARLGLGFHFRKAADGAQENQDTTDVEIDAYNGGLIDVGYGPEVVDLSGIEHAASVPFLVDHDRGRVAGFSATVTNDKASLKLAGKLLVGDGETEGRSVRRRVKAGFPLQASIGWQVLEDEFVPAGQSRTVNGQLLSGPFLHDKRTRVKECSFVTLGADSTTKVRAAKEGRMADTTTVDLVAQERARVREIKAAFPDDKAFAEEQCDKGASLGEAKVAYADRAGAELKKLREEKAAAEKAKTDAEAKLEAEKKAKAPSSTLVPAVRPAGEQGAREAGDGDVRTALEKFRAKVREAKAQGLSPEQATQRVARDNPDLHRDVLAEANPGKQEPAYRAGRK